MAAPTISIYCGYIPRDIVNLSIFLNRKEKDQVLLLLIFQKGMGEFWPKNGGVVGVGCGKGACGLKSLF